MIGKILSQQQTHGRWSGMVDGILLLCFGHLFFGYLCTTIVSGVVSNVSKWSEISIH